MIKIAVVSYDNASPLIPIAAIFGSEQMTIGRSDDNFLVLPDPKHFVSRSQAKVWSDGAQHHLINLSRANPIRINEKEIEPEQKYDLQSGDRIQIGLYQLSVETAETTESSASARIKQTADIKTTPHLPTKTASNKTALSVSATKTPAQLPHFLLRTETTLVQGEHSVRPAESMQKPTQIVQLATISLEASTSNTAAEKSIDVSKSLPDASALLEAFLNGAGLPTINISSGLTAELMETLGKLVATSVQGTMELIAQRALVKREVNAEVTMVVLRKNNPLKFFPDSQTVITQMLRKKMPGFMTPAEAMEDAFLDLRAHQLGVIAGMKATMDATLKKLQPTGVEKQLGAPTLLDYIHPSRRKAAMWDHFSELFDTISLETKDENQSLFGKEFLVAYEEEVEQAKHHFLAP